MSRNGKSTSVGDVVIFIIMFPFIVFMWLVDRLLDAFNGSN